MVRRFQHHRRKAGGNRFSHADLPVQQHRQGEGTAGECQRRDSGAESQEKRQEHQPIDGEEGGIQQALRVERSRGREGQGENGLGEADPEQEEEHEGQAGIEDRACVHLAGKQRPSEGRLLAPLEVAADGLETERQRRPQDHEPGGERQQQVDHLHAPEPECEDEAGDHEKQAVAQARCRGRDEIQPAGCEPAEGLPAGDAAHMVSIG